MEASSPPWGELEGASFTPNTMNNINIRNKRASFDYELIDKYTAGIVLTGTEIKSIRNGKAALVDSYCYFVNNELWIKNMNISEYKDGSYNNHITRRERKLLLHRKELKKLDKKVKETGLAIIPTRMFINESGYAKLQIALAKGKKTHDKRQSLREKDDQRQMDAKMKR
jgi:SsrA-binding protein